MPSSGRIVAMVATALATSTLLPLARADKVILRSGGQIEGHVLPDPADSPTVRVLIPRSENPLSFPRDQVARVEPVEGDVFDVYFKHRDATPDTAQARHDLGLWCEQNGVPGMAPTHYREALERDPNFEPSHKKLGHVLHDGVWMTFAERAEAQGLTRGAKGRWVLRRDPADGDAAAQEALAEDQARWQRTAIVLRQQLRLGTAQERQDAETRLGEIRDPAAVPGLVQVFGSVTNPAERSRLVRLLEPIPGPESRDALLKLLVEEPDPTLWEEIAAALDRRKDDGRAPFLAHVLRSNQPQRVGRAARALARFKERAAVPTLIDALVQYEDQVQWVSIGSRPVGPGAADPYLASGIGQAYVRNVTPVVGPGVVAFQPEVNYVGSGTFLGGGGGNMMDPGVLPTVPNRVRVPRPNAEVLASLESLTRRNFGYDLDAWRRWLRTEFRLEPQPRRQVPEP
jgi:hypothetical protein